MSIQKAVSAPMTLIDYSVIDMCRDTYEKVSQEK